MLVFACVEDNDLFRVISAERADCLRFDRALDAVCNSPAGAGVLLLAEGYPDATTAVPDEVWNIARQKNLRLYIEYPTFIPGLELGSPSSPQAGPYGSIVERIVVASNVFGADLGHMSILASYNCQYLPTTCENPHLVLARVAGFDKAVLGLPETVHPLLLESPRGKVLAATTKLSNCITARYAPKYAWQAVWRWILHWLTPDSPPYRLEWDAAVRPAHAKDDPLPAQAEKELLQRACAWITESRLMVHPADESRLTKLMSPPQPLPNDWRGGDGSCGIMESYTSKRIFLDGRQPVGTDVRADSICQSAMVAAFGARLFDDKAQAAVARNLMDYTYCTSEIFENSPNADDPIHGLLRWTSQPNGLYWTDDSARAILGSISAATLLETDRWDEKICTAILANLRTTGRRGFRPNKCLERDEARKHGWRYYWDFDGLDLYAHFHAQIWSVFLWLFDKTGFAPLYERARAGLAEMMNHTDAWKAEGGRLESEYTRLLLPLAWLVRIDDQPEHREWLRTVADFLLAHQHESGAILQVVKSQESTEIRPEDRRIIEHPLRCNEDYGSEELPIVHDTGDPGTDLLYSLNFAFQGMHEAACATGESRYARAADRMADFLIRVQTRSDAHPELNGTWYRGFDVQHWDYWSSDADWGYGAFTTQTGWTHSLIAATFALRQMNTNLWDITKSSGISGCFEKVRSRMIPEFVLCEGEEK